MKIETKAQTIVHLILAAIFLTVLFSCRSRTSQSSSQLTIPFSITNQFDGEENYWAIVSTNGVWLTIYTNNIGINFGVNRSITVNFDPNSQELQSILIEKDNEWISDFNADGIPDTKRVKGDGSHIFFEGNWYRSEPGDGYASIEVEGKTIKVVHDGSRWRVAE